MGALSEAREHFVAAHQQRMRRVWEKGIVVPELDPTAWRRDRYGALIRRDAYGNALSPYGWEVDHYYPKASGGTDAINNLQPLQCQNNRKKGDAIPPV